MAMTSTLNIEAACTYDLTIGCVFQDEARYLREWLEYHKIVGVQHFVLVDDRSSDDFLPVLQPYIDSGEVELFRIPCPEHMSGPEWPRFQSAVHAGLVSHVTGRSRWLALVDTDEFIVPCEHSNLVRFLDQYEHCGGIYIRWEPFGTGYVDKLKDDELLTERLRLKWKYPPGYDMPGKSIVKPHRVCRADIHRCDLLPGSDYLDSNPDMQSETASIKIYHYWSRDEYFLLNCKLPRSSKIKGWQIDEESLAYFRALYNDIPDHSMQRYTAELRSRVFARSA